MSSFPKQLLQSPSGFPDLGPGAAIAQRRILDVIRTQYERAGFVPIETPLVERPAVLLAKTEGEMSTQVYGLRLMNPAPDAQDDSKDLALRFDQTVPLARFVAANQHEIDFPFRRYVIGPVFRGERAKDGRYRQFTQADIDVIGDGKLELLHDAEIVSIISAIFTELDFGSFTVRINNRKILQGLLVDMGVTTEKISEAIAVVDRIEKVSRSVIVSDLGQLGVSDAKAVDFINMLTGKMSTDETLAALAARVPTCSADIFGEGVSELERVIAGVRSLGVDENRFRIDLSIARGLDYYTGTVYETQFDAYPDLGSIASGGRYENLAGTFTNRNLPGVGISIGVTRLLLRLIKAGLVDATIKTIAPVLVTTALGLGENASTYLDYARRLRESGIATEVYMASKPLGKQLQFADRRRFKLAVIAFEDEIASGNVILRDMKTGEQEVVKLTDLVQKVQRAIA